MTGACTRTYVTPDESVDARDRRGFVGVECYGSTHPEPLEVGAIVKNVKNHRVERGLWVSDCEFVERIFLKDAP